jgi:hypothetical protein
LIISLQYTSEYFHELNLNEFTKNAFAKLVKEFEENTDDVVKINKAFSMPQTFIQVSRRDGSKELNHSLKVALILSDGFLKFGMWT